MSENMRPLEGIKVVELATVVAAPATGRLLADFGAEVIKIEPPVSGDALRDLGSMHWLPSKEDNNPLFDAFNSGKKLTSINLGSESGIGCVHRLLKDADVFLTNTRMKSLVKTGLDYDSLKEKYPGLIYAHFSGFGLKGPDCERPGYDTTAFWMRTGAALDMVPEGAFPARPSFAFGDMAAASYLLNGILIALLGRERTGRGTMVETSLYNSGIWMCAPYVINTQPQYGNKLPYDRYEPWNPFSDCFKCSDGVWIAPLTKNYLHERPFLSELFGLPELVEDPDYADLDRMKRSGKERLLMEHIEKIMLTKSSQEWKQIFERVDLPYEILGHIKDVVNDPQAIANGYFDSVEYPEGISSVPVPPIKLSEYPKYEFRRTGYIGADTDDIMASLGYSASEIEELKRTSAIQ